MLTQAGLTLGALIPQLIGARELGRTRPIMRNAKRAHKALDRGFDKHVDDIKPGKEVLFEVGYNTPTSDNPVEAIKEAITKSSKFAGSSAPGQGPNININPNADRAYFAHEMGHIASQQTDIGHLAASLRANPKLATALTGALMTAPGIAAAVQAGDDDLDESIALAALASAPKLADEALATVHGQQIMNKAGLRTSLGQRGKLAGGLLSYLAAPIIAGAGGNIVGNMLDSDY